MKKWIINSFIQPYSKTYQSLYLLHKYRFVCLFFTAIIILAYPVGHYVYLQHTLAIQKQNHTNIKQQLSQQSKLLSSLKKHYQSQQKEQTAFTQINQAIQPIFDKYQIKTEQWQWSLEQDNQLNLTFTQKSHYLLHSLSEINAIPHLYSKEIQLIKLNQDRLVQFSGTFILSD